MVNLNKFEVFLAVARHKNITRASEELFVSQPAISNAVKQLEIELGGKLFFRRRNGVELTQHGQEIFDAVFPAIESIKEASFLFEKVKQMKKGVLKIGTNTSNIALLLSSSLLNFCHAFPDIELKIFRKTEENLESDLEKGRLDFVFMDKNDMFANFKIVKEFKVKYCLVASSKNKISEKILGFENIKGLDFVLINDTYTSRQNIDDFFLQNGVKIKAKYEVDSYAMVIQMVKLGLGVGIVNPEYFKNELESKQIVILKTKFSFSERELVFGCNSKIKPSITAEKFLEFV